MNDAQEVLDLVDQHDNVIGQIARGDYYKQRQSYDKAGHFIRAVNAFIINSQGQLWVGIRNSARSLWPGGYDFSMGEHIGAGESYQDAFKRGLRDELNLDPDTVTWHQIGKIGPAEGTATLCQGYVVLSDQNPNYNPDEFSGGEWLEPVELLRQLEADRSAHKSDLLPFVRHFLTKLAA